MTNAQRTLRWGQASDHGSLADVMFDAVRNGPSRYSDEQRAAWVPAPRSGPAWDQRLGSQDVILAEADGDVLGFMSLAPGGYIDFAYVRPNAQGTGLLRLMHEAIVQRARERGERRLWLHASLTAEPAFHALGFNVIQGETVVIGGQAFDRSQMQLELQ